MWNDFVTEFRKLVAQRKNYVVFGGLALVTVMMIFIVHPQGQDGYQQRMMREAGTTLANMLDGLYFARMVLLPMHLMILPIFICTVAGDLVAGELQEGCLKLYAARPRSRFSILFTRIAAMMAFTAVICALTSFLALLVGVLLYGMPGPQLILLDQKLTGAEFSILSAEQTGRRMLADFVYRVFSLMALGSLTLFFSCIFKRMTTATVMGITIYFACYFVGLMPQTEDIRPYLLTTLMNSDMYLWLDHVPLQLLTLTFGKMLACTLAFCGLSLAAFTYRDLA